LDIQRLGDLAKLPVEDEIEEDLKSILKFVDVLKEVSGDVEPLLSVGKKRLELREDSPGQTYSEIYLQAPETEGRFIKFKSPIGRKT